MSMSFVSGVPSKTFPLRTISPHTNKRILTYVTQVPAEYFNKEPRAILVQQLFTTDNIRAPQHSHRDAEVVLMVHYIFSFTAVEPHLHYSFALAVCGCFL